MIFGKKIDREMEIMQERNRQYLDSMKSGTDEEEPAESLTDIPEAHEPEKLEFEKGDLAAIVISAFLTFGPIFLVLGGILALAWYFLH